MLMDDELLKRFRQIGRQEHTPDPVVICRLYDTAGTAKWFLTEYDPETQMAFGFVTGLQEDEWGYVFFPELELLIHPLFGIPRIERDPYFKEAPISQILPSVGRG